MLAGHILLGEPGDALPVDGIAFTGEGGAADQTEIYAKAVVLGEVLDNLKLLIAETRSKSAFQYWSRCP